MKLLDCLKAQTWRHLQAISRANGLGFDANLTRSQATRRLAAWLGGEEHLRALATLSVEARAALRQLLAAGGQMAVRADDAPGPTDGDVVEGMPEAVDRHLGAGEVATVEGRASVDVLEPPAQHRRCDAGHRLVLDPRARTASGELVDAAARARQRLHGAEEARLGRRRHGCSGHMPDARASQRPAVSPTGGLAWRSSVTGRRMSEIGRSVNFGP